MQDSLDSSLQERARERESVLLLLLTIRSVHRCREPATLRRAGPTGRSPQVCTPSAEMEGALISLDTLRVGGDLASPSCVPWFSGRGGVRAGQGQHPLQQSAQAQALLLSSCRMLSPKPAGRLPSPKRTTSPPRTALASRGAARDSVSSSKLFRDISPTKVQDTPHCCPVHCRAQPPRRGRGVRELSRIVACTRRSAGLHTGRHARQPSRPLQAKGGAGQPPAPVLGRPVPQA